MPLISVIVPVYKVEKYIRRCVDSILKQTFKDFVLVLVDDGSPDECGKICDDYAQADCRVKVIHQENGGLSAARNSGIDWVFSQEDIEWITFVDSDDWIHPKYLEAMLQAAEEKGVDVVIGGCVLTNGMDPEVSEDISPVVHKTEWYYVYNIVNATVAWGKLYKKSCFENLRFPIRKLHEDEFVTYKILFRYKEVCVIEQPLYAYFQNQDGIVLGKWTPRKFAAIEALEEQVAFFSEHNYYLAAKERFVSLIYQLLDGKKYIKAYEALSDAEKKEWIRKLDQKKRELMLRYRRFHWITIRDKGFYLQAYDSVFPPFKYIHAVGICVKTAFNKVRRRTND